MTTWVVLLGLVAVAGVPYVLWTRLEARKQRRATAIHEDVLALGDEVVPVSIHPDVDLDECIGSGACVRACPEHEVLAITDGRARLINPLSCIGHGACMAACPVGAIKLVFGTATRGIELPRLTPTFETSQPGIYVVGELGGMGLIRNAVEQGRQAAEAIVKSGRRGGPGDLDVIVVGAGPAGISCALALTAHGRRVLIVEQERYGGTIAHYPRAKVVMTGSFALAGYGTVRRRTMSKEQLLELWTDIRERTRLDVKEGVRVEAIRAEGEAWRVIAGTWQDRAAAVVLALGRRGAPRQLGVPGEALPKVAYRLLEPEPFAGKRVLVVGGGNAAADCAIALADAGLCASVALSYRRPELARLRGSVRQAIERAFRDGKIQPLLATEVTAIAEHHVTLETGRGVQELPNDHVIVQIGGQPPSALLQTIGIELVEKRGDA
jgi:thioredoxin reductase/NAD-dependent dihydropyrimidine dehydrogenase PreA subunit